MPKPAVALDLSSLKKPLDLWFARYSTGFKATPVKGKKGYEHHAIRRSGKNLVVVSEAGFDNWGIHRFTSTVTAKASVPPVAVKTEWKSDDVSIMYAPATEKGQRVWRVKASGPDGERSASSELRPDLVPSLVARFLPLFLPREKGVSIAYTVVSEDARQSMFPLVAKPGPRKLVFAGLDQLKSGRTTTPAYRYEHRAGRDVVAVGWVGDDGNFLRHEQPGCVIVATTRADALDGLARELIV